MASVLRFLPNLRLARVAGSDSQRLAEFESVVVWSGSPKWVSDLPLLFPCHPARAKEPRPATPPLPFRDGRVRALSASILRTHSSYPGHLSTLLRSNSDSHSRQALFVCQASRKCRARCFCEKLCRNKCKISDIHLSARIGLNCHVDQRATNSARIMTMAMMIATSMYL